MRLSLSVYLFLLFRASLVSHLRMCLSERERERKREREERERERWRERREQQNRLVQFRSRFPSQKFVCESVSVIVIIVVIVVIVVVVVVVIVVSVVVVNVVDNDPRRLKFWLFNILVLKNLPDFRTPFATSCINFSKKNQRCCIFVRDLFEDTQLRREKLPINWLNSNPRPLDKEACGQPPCYNHKSFRLKPRRRKSFKFIFFILCAKKTSKCKKRRQIIRTHASNYFLYHWMRFVRNLSVFFCVSFASGLRQFASVSDQKWQTNSQKIFKAIYVSWQTAQITI